MKISKNSSSRRETENSIQRGIYILIIHLTRDVKIKIGKIGTKPFTKGYYLYTGSAQGTTSSNLPNRLQRHLNRNKRKYWHIDFLLANKNVKIEQFITVSTTEKIECKINALLKRKLEATIPVKGFGATDCKQKCQSHLLFIGEKEKLEDSICLMMKEMSIKYNLPPNYIYK